MNETTIESNPFSWIGSHFLNLENEKLERGRTRHVKSIIATLATELARMPSPAKHRVKPKRKPLSKSLRFKIFERDGFTCRYCGRGSDEVKLAADHVIPVCEGGSDDESNLVTSCEDCNSGKGGRVIGQSAPTESDRLRLLQEHREQLEAARAASQSARARSDLRQELVNYWCNSFGVEEINRSTGSCLASLANEHGAMALFEWIDIAAAKFPYYNEKSAIRYIYGIRRNVREQQ